VNIIVAAKVSTPTIKFTLKSNISNHSNKSTYETIPSTDVSQNMTTDTIAATATLIELIIPKYNRDT